MGQYNSNRRSNFSGKQNFYAPSNSSLAPVPATQPKSKTKLLIIVLVVAIILVGIFSLVSSKRIQQENSQKIEDSEFYANLEDFKWYSEIFFNDYANKIGFDVTFQYEENFVFPKGNFAALEEEYNKMIEASESILEYDAKNNEDIKSLQTIASDILPQYKENVVFMSQIYSAVMDSYDATIERGNCVTTASFDKLQQENKQLMQEIYTKYCHQFQDTDTSNDASIEKIIGMLKIKTQTMDQEKYNSMMEQINNILRRDQNES